MYTLDRIETFEQEIRKSRFRATACPVSDEAEAKARLAELAEPDASHNCWAWRIGGTYRFSDDGEPGGTAGRPILQAIDGQELDRILVVVTRWFGGILLGSGGLVRAYGGTAATCLRQAEKSLFVAREALAVSVGFSDLALVKSRLAATGVPVEAERFHETGAALVLRVPAGGTNAVTRMIADLTGGRAEIGGPAQ